MSSTNNCDLTSQFNKNLNNQLLIGPGSYYSNTNSNQQSMNVKNGFQRDSSGMRGLSRGSKQSHGQRSSRVASHVINTNNITAQSNTSDMPRMASNCQSHPNTAGSQKRNMHNGAPMPHQTQQIKRNQQPSKNDELEYLPLQTMSYASQRNDNDQVRNEDPINQYNTQKQQSTRNGVGGLSVLNDHLHSQGTDIGKLSMPQTQPPSLGLSGFNPHAKTEQSEKLKDHNHSKSGIIGPMPGSTTNSSMRIGAPNDFRIGKINNYQKMSNNSIMQKRNSGHGGTYNMSDMHSNTNKFLLNNGEESSGLPTLGPDSIGLSSNHLHTGSQNLRKMSLAAKSGQMQIFNNMNVNHSIQPKQLGHEQLEIGTKNHMSTAQKQQSLPPAHPKNLAPLPQTQYLNPQTQTSETLNLNNQNTPLGSRHFESYASRRQIIEQQREKKQELLKQLDNGARKSKGQFNTNQKDLVNQNDNPDSDYGFQNNNNQNLQISGQSPTISLSSRKRSGNVIHAHTQNNSISGPPDQTPQTISGIVRGPNPLQSQQQLPRDPPARRRFKGSHLSTSGQAPVPEFNGNSQSPQNIDRMKQMGGEQEFSHYLQQQLSPSVKQQMLQENDPSAQNGLGGAVISGISFSGLQNSAPSCINGFKPSSYTAEKQKHAEEITKNNTDLQNMVHNNQQQPVEQRNSQEEDQKQNNINSRITRKLEGGRPHKIYDYMFIQMSNEQFQKEYAGRKIQIQQDSSSQEEDKQPIVPQGGLKTKYMYGHGSVISPKNAAFNSFANEAGSRQHKFLSPNKSPEKGGKMLQIGGQGSSSSQNEQLNLKGLVQIKAYDSQYTDELPTVQCNLLPSQLDHLKVLVCEQEDKKHPKLTAEAQGRFEIEKQNQIKQYMEDIIQKLEQKDRKFKVTFKKKFVHDALFNSTSIRVASVYVIVINRERTYDPVVNGRNFKARKKLSDIQKFNQAQSMNGADSSSDEEGEMSSSRNAVLNNDRLIKSINMQHSKKRSLYDSDSNQVGDQYMNSTSTSSNVPQFKKLLEKKDHKDSDGNVKTKRSSQISTGPNFKKASKKNDEGLDTYKYVQPVKDFKYGPTKIKINHNIKAHKELHQKHHLNVYFNQYNEFIKLMFKNKAPPKEQTNVTGKNNGFNVVYALGLAKALGLNLKKDAFSEQNMKSRDHLGSIKEKLAFAMYKKIHDENKDITPAPPNQSALSEQPTSSHADRELDNDTLDSSSNCNNTPKSKNVSSHAKVEVDMSQNFTLPPPNISYKYVIGKGNNSIMVRSLFKNRFWWVKHDKEELETNNFVWTQIKKAAVMEALSCKYPNVKSGIKNVSAGAYNPQSVIATPQQKSSKKIKQNQQNSDKQTTGKNNNLNNGQQSSACDNTKRFTDLRLYNKIEDNFHMNNKKALYLNLKNYYEAMDQDIFNTVPLTFHVKNGLEDPEFVKFKQYYNKCEEDCKNKKAQRKQQKEQDKQKKIAEEEGLSPANSPIKNGKQEEEQKYYQSQMAPKNIWIIKPGENTNQGHGIQVAKEFNEIQGIIEDSTANSKRTCIVQKYIHNPLLLHRRKFDIRTYVLMTSVNGNTKVYIYEEGYLRTSCREYSVNNLSNRFVHLTNDAVQKKAEDYGKFEAGNKLSYNEFQQIIDKNYPDLNICFERDILPQMNKMTTDIFRACHGKLDPKRRQHCMEVFGLDFMIDDEFKPYLIEVNTNPCLELSSPLLARLIPTMLENALKIALDPLFLPPESFTSKKAFIGDAVPESRFELVFDSKVDGPVLDKLFLAKENIIIEMDEDELSEEEELDDEEE